MNHQFSHLVGHAFRESKHLTPVPPGRSAFAAFFAGFLFGPFGTGVYLRSWTDFFVPLGLIFAGTFLTAGLGAPVFWMLCGAWGAVRVRNSRHH